MTLVDPSLIAFLAIVIVASWSRRSWPPPGRGCRETLPKDIPVPRDAVYSQTPEANGPASPEWVVRDNSHDAVSPVTCRHRRRNVSLNAFVDSWSCPSLYFCLGTWRRVALSVSEHPAQRRATSAQLRRSRALRVAGASPQMSDHGAICPNLREFAKCQQSLACLHCRRAGGVVLRSNPVASSRPTDAYA